MIEEHARLKQQLFRLLELSTEGHYIYSGSESLSRLFPDLSSGAAASSYTTQIGTAAKDENEIYQNQTRKLEEHLKSSHDKIAELRLK